MEKARAHRLQVQRLDFSPGCLGSGSPPAPVQRTHGAAIQANSLFVQPHPQHVGTHGYIIYPPSPPP
eukprot:12932019-Prorocentrum_lima.AAC.1